MSEISVSRAAMENTDPILSGNDPKLVEPPLFHVALIEPEIPQNTGNIGRTCVGTRSDLHLVGKLGFRITDKNLKRAGLDYWQHLSWKHHERFEDWQNQLSNPKRVFYFSTKAKQSYFEAKFEPGDWFVFGKETKGLDEDLLRRNPDQLLKIPILGPIRSLNVATAVTVVLYEAIRQVRLSEKFADQIKSI
jgi:tRNA (cytidine/uridine-2'-O-)-methyltransferase